MYSDSELDIEAFVDEYFQLGFLFFRLSDGMVKKCGSQPSAVDSSLLIRLRYQLST